MCSADGFVHRPIENTVKPIFFFVEIYFLTGTMTLANYFAFFLPIYSTPYIE